MNFLIVFSLFLVQTANACDFLQSASNLLPIRDPACQRIGFPGFVHKRNRENKFVEPTNSKPKAPSNVNLEDDDLSDIESIYRHYYSVLKEYEFSDDDVQTLWYKCPELFGVNEPSALNETMTILHKLLPESQSFLDVVLAVPVCLTYSPIKMQEILQTYDDTYGVSQKIFTKLLKKSPELLDPPTDYDEESSKLWNDKVSLLFNSVKGKKCKLDERDTAADLYETPNMVSSSTQHCLQYLDSLFSTDKPADRSILSTKTCIMGNLTDLDVPLIDFNVSEVSAEVVLYAKNVPGTSPERAFMAFVRGKGGGKSRSFFEVERHINENYPECMAISITFSGRWDSFENEISDRFTYFQPIIYYEVLSRILSMYYGLSLDTIYNMLNRYVREMDERDVRDMFEATVYHILRKEKKRHFILLVDESLRLVNYVSGLFPSNMDYWRSLRVTLLYEMRCGGLVMSGANLVPVRKSTLDETVLTVEYPERISVESILNILWLPLFRNQLDSAIIKKLKVLAAAVNGIPSLVAEIFFSIREWNQNNQLTHNNYKEFIRFIMNQVKTFLRLDYALDAENFTPNVMFPTVLIHLLKINEENSDFINNSIMTSVYINIFDYFPDRYEYPVVLIPDTSFLRILGAINPEDPVFKVPSDNQNFYKILLSLLTGFESILEDVDLVKIENSLDGMFYNLLRLKFCCLFTASDPPLDKKTISLNKFFFMHMVDYGKSPKLRNILNTDILIPGDYSTIQVQRFTSSLFLNPDEFMVNLDGLYRSWDYVQLISSAANDCFDHLIILKTASLPILIFIKSESFSSILPLSELGAESSVVAQLHFELFTVRTSRVWRTFSGKIFDAIRDGNFIYMYTTIDDVESMVLDENCVLLGRNAMKNFLRFVWPVYETAKTAIREEL
jgi:hypothetical protein